MKKSYLEELQKMNRNDLYWICKEIGVKYNKHNDKKKLIYNLISPLKNKKTYKMNFLNITNEDEIIIEEQIELFKAQTYNFEHFYNKIKNGKYNLDLSIGYNNTIGILEQMDNIINNIRNIRNKYKLFLYQQINNTVKELHKIYTYNYQKLNMLVKNIENCKLDKNTCQNHSNRCRYNPSHPDDHTLGIDSRKSGCYKIKLHDRLNKLKNLSGANKYNSKLISIKE